MYVCVFHQLRTSLKIKGNMIHQNQLVVVFTHRQLEGKKIPLCCQVRRTCSYANGINNDEDDDMGTEDWINLFDKRWAVACE